MKLKILAKKLSKLLLLITILLFISYFLFSCRINTNKTIFDYITSNNQQELIKYLDKHPEQINTQQYKEPTPPWEEMPNFTPLHYACYLGNFEIIKILVERGADVNNVSPSVVPLVTNLRSTSSSRIEIAYYLIEHGANPAALDKTNRYNILGSLIRNGDNNSKEQKEEFEFAKKVIEDYGVSYSEHLYYYGHLLFYAAIYNNTLLAEYLLEKGCDVNMSNSYGTSLHYAVQSKTHNNYEVVVMLLNYGANKSALNKNGETPLDEAIKVSQSKDIIDLLS